MRLESLDIGIIAVYFVVVLGLGLWLARRGSESESEDDYFVAGRQLGWFAIGASLFASNISSEHLTGLAADGFSTGLAVGNYEWGACIVLVVLAVVFVPFYVGSRIRTLPEYLERRFGSGARIYLSIVTILANVLVRISVALYAGALVMHTLFGVGLWTSIFVLAVTTVIYTAAGGLRAVVYTDGIQAVVLLVGTIVLTWLALDRVGGWQALTQQVPGEMFDMVRPADDPTMPWTGLLLGVPILGIWYWCTDQVIVQRVLGARGISEARKGAMFAAVLKILPVFLFVLPGLCGRVIFPDANAKQIFPIMVAELLPTGLKGLVAAGLIAALMSSIDSTLNSTGTLVSLDLYQRWRPDASSARVVSVGRITTVAVMIFGIAWVLVVKRADSLFQYLQQVQAAISPPIAAAFLVGVLWRRGNHAGVMSALVVGFLLGMAQLVHGALHDAGIHILFTPPHFLTSATIGFFVSLAVLVGVSLLTPPPPVEKLQGLTWDDVRDVVEQETSPRQRRRFQLMVAAVVGVMVVLWVLFSGPVEAESRPPPRKPEPASVGSAPLLRFDIQEGKSENHFLRQGEVAAHLVLTSGEKARLLVAFPAGNSGAALWLGDVERLELEGALEPVVKSDGMRGVRGTVRASGKRLELDEAVLGTVRAIRDHVHGRPTDPAMRPAPAPGPPLRWSRRRLDDERRYALTLEPVEGTSARVEGKGAVLETSGADVRFTITALTDEAPLTPLEEGELLQPSAARDERARQALSFLSYREKFLAGSWRFLTYFGRDTLLTVRLLMPVLQPEAVEAALGSVLERLDRNGDVAHEEDIGEQAVRRCRVECDSRALDEPMYDYRMIDDDFLLASVVARHLSDHPERARAFLARKTGDGTSYAAALRKNLQLVRERAGAYRGAPGVGAMIALAEGEMVGQWRDSDIGLGEGKVPYDVNAALVPAALEAAAALYEGPLRDAEAAADARALGEAWKGAARHFVVELAEGDAKERVRAYADEVGVPAEDALASIEGPVRYTAVALHADGRPVEVLHSDEGFVLLFTDPAAEELERIAETSMRPFPAGLMTPVGMLVANPAYADDAGLRPRLGRDAYHGTVVWSWQQALFAAGLARQLARSDLPAETRERLAAAHAALWKVIDATKEQRTTELWSWEMTDGAYALSPFGQRRGHETESNAAQLWSTVYLAVRK